MWPTIGGKRPEVFVALITTPVVVVDGLEICRHTFTSLSHAGRFSGVTPIPLKSSHTKSGFDFSTATTSYVFFN